MTDDERGLERVRMLVRVMQIIRPWAHLWTRGAPRQWPVA